ncbi:four helix bundle protein [Paraferrimonas sedimenticola]|uniref:Four helix bundle protein n=1 Tax=Paraferrimonas sedimenticola TaxID=375674 RepID=A0AA37VST1_9GAMM|nr:four helix bundle protein [Paraferrimonas sedimenticola]GLP94946.1 hypothetical protein GCM10007895_02520 [Paraferrimonas sedimenticola]
MFYEDLNVWKKSTNQACAVVQIIGMCDNNALKDRITTTALAIPTSIAHGQNRRDKTECIRYLERAIGSNAELATQLTIGQQAGLIDPQACKELLEENNVIGRMLGSLIRAKRNQGQAKTNGQSAPNQAQANSG